MLFDSKEKKFLKNFCLKGRIVYDIGAYIGKTTTKLFSKLVSSDGLVYAFEANPNNFKKLCRLMSKNKNVIPINKALGSKMENKRMFIPTKEPGRGTFNNKISINMLEKEEVEMFEVVVFSLDNLITEMSLLPPHFIKIDVEGMEYEVILGMTQLLMETKPLLFIELHGVDKKHKLENFLNIFQFLTKNNYTIRHVESNKIISKYNMSTVTEGHIFCWGS